MSRYDFMVRGKRAYALGGASVALAIGMIVLLRSESSATTPEAEPHEQGLSLAPAPPVYVGNDAEALSTVIDAEQAESVEDWRARRSDRVVRRTRQNIGALEAQQSYSLERANRIREYNCDIQSFSSSQPSSRAGRQYGLRSNEMRRNRTQGRR